MQTVSTAFETLLTKAVNEEIESLQENIGRGMLSPEDYKFQCGKLAGMRQVLGYFDEINAKLSER